MALLLRTLCGAAKSSIRLSNLSKVQNRVPKRAAITVIVLTGFILGTKYVYKYSYFRRSIEQHRHVTFRSDPLRKYTAELRPASPAIADGGSLLEAGAPTPAAGDAQGSSGTLTLKANWPRDAAAFQPHLISP